MKYVVETENLPIEHSFYILSIDVLKRRFFADSSFSQEQEINDMV